MLFEVADLGKHGPTPRAMNNADDAATAVMHDDTKAAPNLGNQRIRAFRSVWVCVARPIEVGRHPFTARAIHLAHVTHFCAVGNVRPPPIPAMSAFRPLRTLPSSAKPKEWHVLFD